MRASRTITSDIVPVWTRLYRSPVAERSAAEGFFAAIEFELNQERAAVLNRCGKKIEKAIAQCHAVLAQQSDGVPIDSVAYNRARRAALEAIDELCLQREMLGVYDNPRVHQLYPVPPALD